MFYFNIIIFLLNTVQYIQLLNLYTYYQSSLAWLVNDCNRKTH